MTKQSKATNELLDMLHQITAQELADVIKNGVPIVNKETGEIEGRSPAPASYIAAAIKFLKDNDITADPRADRFNPLTNAMVDLPDLDDLDEYGDMIN